MCLAAFGRCLLLQVGVQPACDANVRVAEQGADLRELHALSEQSAGARVSQVMESDLRQLGGLEELVQHAPDVACYRSCARGSLGHALKLPRLGPA